MHGTRKKGTVMSTTGTSADTSSRAQEPPIRRERLETRLTSEEKALLQRAAALEHQSMTEFVRQRLRTAATETIRQHETLVLSVQDMEVFVEALMNPPEPGERLRSAAAAHRALIQQ